MGGSMRLSMRDRRAWCRVDCNRRLPEPMLIYRPGRDAERIRAVAGPVETFRSEVLETTPREAMPSPGVG